MMQKTTIVNTAIGTVLLLFVLGAVVGQPVVDTSFKSRVRSRAKV